MPKFPEPPPPGGLAARLTPDLTVLPAGTLLFRIYLRGGDHPAEWNGFRFEGPLPTSRFDQHVLPKAARERGILYAAHGQNAVSTPFAEVFQDTRTIDRLRRDPWLVGFELTGPVALLDLSGTWPTRAGASMAISTGRRDRARRRSRRIYEDYPDVEGLLYPSSMYANQPAIALYERAGSALPERPTFHRALIDGGLDGLVRTVAKQLNYGVVPP